MTRLRAPEGTILAQVIERTLRAAETGESTAGEWDHCGKCGRGTAEGLAIYHRLLTTEAEIDENVGPLNAMDQWMRRKPGDDIATYVVCPCCSFAGCPDTARGHRLAELAAALRGAMVVKALALPGYSWTTTPDHPAWQEAWPGGPLLAVHPDASCVYGNVSEGYDDDGVLVIVDYVGPERCDRPQCRPWAEADCTGDPEECPSSCRLCYPSALIAVAA